MLTVLWHMKGEPGVVTLRYWRRISNILAELLRSNSHRNADSGEEPRDRHARITSVIVTIMRPHLTVLVIIIPRLHIYIYICCSEKSRNHF